MASEITPRNRVAQLLYRATGNPPNTLPTSAISNSFPGLEYDFRAFWRRSLVGIVLLESDNFIIEADNDHQDLLHRRLLKIDGRDVVTTVSGPQMPGGPVRKLSSGDNPDAVAWMEWSNLLTHVMRQQGSKVKCVFTQDEVDSTKPLAADFMPNKVREMQVRQMLQPNTAAPGDGVLEPGELTQGLCSPWQHDYRECACYYWPASRPDYVNVETTEDGVSRGDNWMSKQRTGEYALDDRRDSRFVSYDDLFRDWEAMLRFEIKGRDATHS